MAAFNATNKAPGVYIEEVQVPGPIAGVGTSTAAFIGPAEKGPINKPTFITNWTQFQNTFGDYIFAPMVYVTHAVRGFFENGGSSCYFTRVGTAVRSSLTLIDKNGKNTILVTAKEEGLRGDLIKVKVDHSSITSDVKAVQEEASVVSSKNNEVTVGTENDAKKFRPGDIVTLKKDNTERGTIASISIKDKKIILANSLEYSYDGGVINIADLEIGQKKIRFQSTDGIELGSYISITQGNKSESGVVQAVEHINKFIMLAQGLKQEYVMTDINNPVKLDTLEFSLIISTPGNSKDFPNLAMDPRHSRYFEKKIDSTLVDITISDPPSTSSPPDNIPVEINETNLAGGEDDDKSQIKAKHYNEAIEALEKVDDVNMLCIPDSTDLEVQLNMIGHCENMQDRFAILDPQRNVGPTNGIITQRNLIGSDRGYGALYYPWIEIANPVVSGQIKVPPSGHIAGIYARSDNERGVHKAPANEQLKGVLALEKTLTEAEQGKLNEIGVNVLRSAPGRGPVVWGARTISSSTQWRYVNVRRLLLYIEESIQEGTQFAVFEPNNLELWQKVKRQVTDFLTRVWRDGALFGATPEQAFRVRIDEELNPPSVRALGQLIIEVVLYPTTPAEFVVFRVIQQPGGPTVQE